MFIYHVFLPSAMHVIRSVLCAAYDTLGNVVKTIIIWGTVMTLKI